MSDFKPGDRVRLIADGTIVTLADGQLGVQVDGDGSLRGCAFDLDTFNVHPAGPAEYEWTVEHDGYSGTRTGFPAVEDEDVARDFATRPDIAVRNPTVLRSRVDRGPWEQAPDV